MFGVVKFIIDLDTFPSNVSLPVDTKLKKKDEKICVKIVLKLKLIHKFKLTVNSTSVKFITYHTVRGFLFFADLFQHINL